MERLGINLDLGTSGFRGQAMDLERSGHIISTAVTTRHPMPGANVIDHLHYALEVGRENAHRTITQAVNKVIGSAEDRRKQDPKACGMREPHPDFLVPGHRIP